MSKDITGALALVLIGFHLRSNPRAMKLLQKLSALAQSYKEVEKDLYEIIETSGHSGSGVLLQKVDILNFAMEMAGSEKMMLDPSKATLLEKPISELDLNARTLNVFRRENIQTVADLLRKTRKEVREFKDFGAHSLSMLDLKLKVYGLKLE